ncbi:MAG: hypothetical protein AAGG06_06730 [Pseudomonadota bacterium]
MKQRLSKTLQAVGVTLFLALLPAGEAAAAALSAQAGPRPQLRLDRWPEDGWVVDQTGRTATILFRGAVFPVDLSRLDLTGLETAVARVAVQAGPSGTGLVVDLACDCGLALRGDAATGLIIDIAGASAPQTLGPAPRPERAEIEGAEGSPDDPPEPEPDLARQGGSAPRTAPRPQFRGSGAISSADPAATASAARSRIGPPTPDQRAVGVETPSQLPADPQTPEPQPVNADLDGLRERLLSQFARAAEAGLIDLRPGSPLEQRKTAARVAAAEAAAAEAEAAEVSQEAAEADLSLETEQNSPVAALVDPDPSADAAPANRAANAVPDQTPLASAGQISAAEEAIAADDDRDLDAAGSDPARLAYAAGEPGCAADAVLALPDPDGRAAFLDALREGRSALVGEFDRAEPDATMDLARLYIAHGMGSEAAVLLADFAPKHPETPLLAAMAQLSEGRALGPDHALSSPDCGGVHAVWAGLADSLNGGFTQERAEAILADGALELLPAMLRGRIASRLGRAVFEAGAVETADALRAIAGRSDPTERDDPHWALLDAGLSRVKGEPDKALARLQAARQVPGEEGTEALIGIADMVLRSEVPGVLGTRQLRADLGIRALELRGSEIGAEAFVAEADLLGRAEGREAALELLSHGLARALIDRDQYLDAVRRVSIGEHHGDDPRPLALIYHDNPERFRLALEEPGFRHALARSYAEIGTPMLAKDILRRGDLDEPILAEALSNAAREAGDLAAMQMLLPRMPDGAMRDALQSDIDRLQRFDALLASLRRDDGSMTAPNEMDAPALAGKLGDLTAAFDAAPSLETARSIALAAAAAGATEMPPAAATLLAEADRRGFRELSEFFEPSPAETLPPSAAAVADYLNTVTDEVNSLREFLENG